jgi:hypothetical protein
MENGSHGGRIAETSLHHSITLVGPPATRSTFLTDSTAPDR